MCFLFRFIANCPSGSKHRVVNVEAQAKLHFVCPNVATLMKNTFTEVSKISKYENLWIVHNKRSFDECDSSLDAKSAILMRCKAPTSLQFRTVIFQRHSAENNLQFEKGESYYFIGECMPITLSVECFIQAEVMYKLRRLYIHVQINPELESSVLSVMSATQTQVN